MSRSRRKTPITGWSCCRSEKEWKQRWHRRLRTSIRRHLRQTMDDTRLPHHYEVSNPWRFGKDGKQWFGGLAHPPDGDHLITASQECIDLYNRLLRK